MGRTARVLVLSTCTSCGDPPRSPVANGPPVPVTANGDRVNLETLPSELPVAIPNVPFGAMSSSSTQRTPEAMVDSTAGGPDVRSTRANVLVAQEPMTALAPVLVTSTASAPTSHANVVTVPSAASTTPHVPD